MQLTNRATNPGQPISPKQYLSDLLESFDQKKSFRSRVIEAEVICKCKRFTEDLDHSYSFSNQQREALGFIVFCDTTWNFSKIKAEKKSATAIFLTSIQRSLFSNCYDTIHSSVETLLACSKLLTSSNAQAVFVMLTQSVWKYTKSIALGCRRLSDAGLLSSDQEQESFNLLTQCGGKYAKSIAEGLWCLAQAGLIAGCLAQARRDSQAPGSGPFEACEHIRCFITYPADIHLSSDQVQEVFNLLMQSNGQYAESIASAVAYLHKTNLLSGDQRQINYYLLTQGAGKYADPIADGLMYLYKAGLLSGHHGQENFNLLTQNGGKYADSIQYGLYLLSYKDLLKSRLQAQKNFNLLTQCGGQYAKCIAEGLVILSDAGLLIGDQTQINREALTQNFGQHAVSIAEALVSLGLLNGSTRVVEGMGYISQLGFLADDHAHSTLDLYMQDSDRYVAGILMLITYLLTNSFESFCELELKHIVASFKIISYEGGGSPEFLTSVIKKTKERGQLTPLTYQLLVPGTRAFGDERLPRLKSKVAVLFSSSKKALKGRIEEKMEEKAFFQILKVLGLSPDNMRYVYQKNRNPQSMLNQIILLHALVSTSVDELSPLVCELVSMVPAEHEYLLEPCHSYLCHSAPEEREVVLTELIHMVKSYLEAKDVKNDSLANEVFYTLSQQSLFNNRRSVVDYCRSTAAPAR
jgi:hypothetical protein